MEPRGAAGYYDPASERYTLHTPIQRSLHYREEMAQVLRVPESQVRIIGGDIGGSFGMKTGPVQRGRDRLARRKDHRPARQVDVDARRILHLGRATAATTPPMCRSRSTRTASFWRCA